MEVPTYLLEKIARHGVAAQRLRHELDSGEGEFNKSNEAHAIAFDAADFVWAFLSLYAGDEAQESRYVRNQVAESILNVLSSVPWMQDTSRG
ncbi:hypothetical protein [Paraburkholderia atlantica]|uniref:hypothetical protein n=1 Tax=Paraburkholderia atlantica TaxID=2654982 RepID=UPI0003746662|nr:hypothetical protein [Paraburkholderia atlantica]